MTARILALGAWLKNQACLLDGTTPHWSALHGDLRDADACAALEASARALVQRWGLPDAVAHDLHPDFYSTHLAQSLADEWGVPAIGVQHHHAHNAGVMAEQGCEAPVIGVALDGVGLGTDGQSWGGELLRVDARGFARLGHLWPLALPGGDVAAREPWRVLASALHALGRGDEIVARLQPLVGESAAVTIQGMLQRQLMCPATTSAGRWFDAASAALSLAPRLQQEAEAAMALERSASRHAGAVPQRVAMAVVDGAGVLDLRPLLAELLDWHPRKEADVSTAAAWFHQALADGLATWASAAARRERIGTVVLSGGCFFNRLLSARLQAQLQAAGLRVLWPQSHSAGDAGIALGQAWVAARQSALSANAREEGVCA